MNSIYEVIAFPDKLPVRCYLHTVMYFRLHWHKEIEFLVVLKGEVNLMLQNGTTLLREGDVAVVSSGLIHATQPTTEPNVLLVLQADCEHLAGVDEAAESMTFDTQGADEEQRAALRATLCAAMLEMVYRRPGYQYKTLSLVNEAFACLMRSFPHRPSPAPEGGRQPERDRIDRIVGYINENYVSRLSLGEIARREHLSVNHLSTFIHKTLGISFGDYLKFIRLKAYMECLYQEPGAALDDIALKCGFSSPQYATALFRETYQITPGKFRKRISQMSLVRKKAMDADTAMGYIPQYQPDDLSLVFKYAGGARLRTPGTATRAAEEINVSAAARAGRYCKSAVRVACIGRAHEGLMASVQSRLRAAKKELGFEYLRFHGIFSDDMMILRPEPSGSVAYAWRSTDALLDFLMEIGVRPFIELTYMPSLLSSGDQTVFLWRGNITPPAEIQAWRQLTARFVRHCAERYGAQEVSSWYFEVWNEPDYRGVSWAGDMQSFLNFYAQTASAIREVLPGARICGPSVSMASEQSHRWIGPFLEYCREKSVPPDALTIHTYPEIVRPDNLREDIMHVSLADKSRLNMLGQDYVTKLLSIARKQLALRDMPLPVIVTEWNITLKAFNPINDAAFAATAMLKSAFDADAEDVLLAHWTLDDYMEEQTLPASELCGGFGLFTCRGVRKPTYFAMRALAWLHADVVLRADGLMVTRQGSSLRMLAFHHPETPLAFDIAYTQHAAPEGLQTASERAFRLTLRDVAPGRYILTHRLYDAEVCSPKALLRACGMAEPLSDEGVAWLREVSQPLFRTESVTVSPGGALSVSFTLGACCFETVEAMRIDEI